MKKRIISIFFILSLSVFSLSGCKQNPKTDTPKETSATESTKAPQNEVEDIDSTSDIEKNFEQDLKENYLKSGGEIAFLTQSEDIFDKGYCEAIFKGIAQYAYSSGKTYSYYYPAIENKENFYNTMKTAIDDGAELIVTSSDSYNEIIGSIQYDYSDDYFLMVDGHPTDEENNPIDLNTNVHCIKFDEYTSGYIAGYITAQEGYKSFGFLGGKENDSVKAYGYGFVKGIDDYAKQTNNPADYSLNYCYTNTFSASDKIYKKAKAWYESGTEVIFSCGGNIFKSITQAANETDKKVIGVDVNQNLIEPCVITSANKGVDIGVITALDDFFASYEWSSKLAGQTTICGTESWCASIPAQEDSWKFKNVTIEEYLDFYLKIRSGDIKLNKDISMFPEYTINLEKY